MFGKHKPSVWKFASYGRYAWSWVPQQNDLAFMQCEDKDDSMAVGQRDGVFPARFPFQGMEAQFGMVGVVFELPQGPIGRHKGSNAKYKYHIRHTAYIYILRLTP